MDVILFFLILEKYVVFWFDISSVWFFMGYINYRGYGYYVMN